MMEVLEVLAWLRKLEQNDHSPCLLRSDILFISSYSSVSESISDSSKFISCCGYGYY